MLRSAQPYSKSSNWGGTVPGKGALLSLEDASGTGSVGRVMFLEVGSRTGGGGRVMLRCLMEEWAIASTPSLADRSGGGGRLMFRCFGTTFNDPASMGR